MEPYEISWREPKQILGKKKKTTKCQKTLHSQADDGAAPKGRV